MRLDGLTVVRFLAALWVFVFHFGLRLPLNAPTPLARIIANGPLAMPIFFMLSGFALAYGYRAKYETFSRYFRARVARIYPAYLLGVVACLPFICDYTPLIPQGPADAATVLLVLPVDLLLLQAWYPNLWLFWHHAGTWAISTQMFLYASFPLLLGFAKLRTRSLVLAIIGCVLLAGSFIPSLSVGASTDLPLGVYYAIPMFSLPAFTIGVALTELHRRGFQGFAGAPFLLLVLLAVAGQYNARYAALNVIILPLIALSLLFAARPPQRQGLLRFATNRCTVYLGEISYGFFIYQIPLLLLLQHYLAVARALPVWLVGSVMLGLDLAMAAASHRWFEPWGSRMVVKYWQCLASPRRNGPSQAAERGKEASTKEG